MDRARNPLRQQKIASITYLNVFDVVVEEQLNEDRNHVLLADKLPVQFLLREDV